MIGKTYLNLYSNNIKDITMRNYTIAVAGTGYVGLSIATLLSQHHQVTAVDVIPEKVEKINKRISPIQDEYIEKYLAEKELNLTATLDGASAYKNADFVVLEKDIYKIDPDEIKTTKVDMTVLGGEIVYEREVEE